MNRALLVCLLVALAASAAAAQTYTPIFRTPVQLTNTLVNTASTEYAPSITGDGLTLYFCSNRVGSNASSMDMWMVTRHNFTAAWSNPTPLTSINSSMTETYMDVRDDDLEMFFSSQAPLNNVGLNDLYVAWRSSVSTPWIAANMANMGTLINTTSSEDDPTVTADGLELYWASPTRPEGGTGTASIYRITRKSTSSPWSTLVQWVAEIDSTFQDHSPAISPDGLSIIFSSTRVGTGSDLYLATRTGIGTTFSVPVPVTELNSIGGWDHNGQWSGDGFSYYYTQNSTNDIWRADRILPMCLLSGGAYVLSPGVTGINGGDTLIVSCRRDPGDVGIILGALAKIPPMKLAGIQGMLNLNLGTTIMPPWIGPINNHGRWSLILPVPKDKRLHGTTVYFQCAAQDQASPAGIYLSSAETVSIVVR